MNRRSLLVGAAASVAVAPVSSLADNPPIADALTSEGAAFANYVSTLARYGVPVPVRLLASAAGVSPSEIAA